MRAFGRVRRLVGDVTPEQLKFIDWTVAGNVGVFVPVAGQCGYAVTENHVHPAYSFLATLDDRCRARVDGRVLRSRPGELVAFAPDVQHEELLTDPPSRFVAVMIEPACLRREAAAYGRKALPPWRGEAFACNKDVVPTAREMLIEKAAGLPGHQAVIAALARRLIHLVLRSLFGVPCTHERVAGRDGIRRAVELVHARLDHPLALADLARSAGMSPFHFSREFKRETGKSPGRYLSDARLARAKMLLAADDRPVTEIALACGFASASHLSSAFAKAFNMQPSRYRAMLSGRPRDKPRGKAPAAGSVKKSARR
jgi:AraC family transcriptional regulator